MSVSLTDMLSAAKNIVTAINGLAQSYVAVQGAGNVPAISTGTIVKNSSGRVAVVSVTTAGSAVGTIYDSATATATRPIYIIPNTVGVYVVNLPAAYGIYVVPGTSQVVTVSYS